MQAGEYGHGHYDVWRVRIRAAETSRVRFLTSLSISRSFFAQEFNALVERQLDAMLAELGGSVSMLEKAIDERAAQLVGPRAPPPRGPRHAAEAQIVEELSCCASFREVRARARGRASRPLDLTLNGLSRANSLPS